MSSVRMSPFKLWITINLACFASSAISSQRFVIHDALSISTYLSDVTEIECSSVINCALACLQSNFCHISSYDTMTNRCRILTSKGCGVQREAIPTSVFLKRDAGKLHNCDIFPLVVSIYL